MQKACDIGWYVEKKYTQNPMQDEMPFDLSHYIINKNFRDLFSQPEKKGWKQRSLATITTKHVFCLQSDFSTKNVHEQWTHNECSWLKKLSAIWLWWIFKCHLPVSFIVVRGFAAPCAVYDTIKLRKCLENHRKIGCHQHRWVSVLA